MRSPFESEIADPYAREFVDVETLNAHASDAIAKRVREARERALNPEAGLRSWSLTILGPAGAGKTHLFARLRKMCGHHASLVLQRPEVGVELTLLHVLSTLVDGLRRKPPAHDDTLIEVIVGSFLAAMHDGDKRFPSMLLAELRARGPGAIDDAIARALDEAEGRYPELDAEWLEQLLRVPFGPSAQQRAAMAWLSGREPSDTDLKKLGRTERLATQSVLPALRTLGIVAAVGAPIVLVFDQLENLADDDHRQIHAHARVLADLVDGVRGFVIVQMALESEWQRRIAPVLTQAERARLQAEVHVVQLPTAAQRDELLRRWIAVMPEDARPQPFPAPFSEAQWTRLRTQAGLTPRALLVAARHALAGEEPLPEASEPSAIAEPASDDVDDRLAALWNDRLARARDEHDALADQSRGFDADRLAAALVAVARLRTGAPKVEATRARHKHDLGIASAPPKLVFLAQSVHHRSLGATFQHAHAAAAEHDVLVVRQGLLAIPVTWNRVRQHLDALHAAPRARVVELSRDEVAQLVAAHDFLAAARSQDLTGPDGQPLGEERVREWLVANVDPARTRVLADSVDDDLDGTIHLPLPLRHSEHPPPMAGAALMVLERLRLASIERVVREATALGASRGAVLTELESSARVQRFGSSIVWLREEGLL